LFVYGGGILLSFKFVKRKIHIHTTLQQTLQQTGNVVNRSLLNNDSSNYFYRL